MGSFFSSDAHFGHTRVIDYSNRPFSSVEEMDATLIKNWNNVVSSKDDIYFLGDLSFHKKERTLEIVKHLNGRKHWILGNHDYKNKHFKDQDIAKHFVWIKDLIGIKVQDKDAYNGAQRITLCHYAMRTFPQAHYGAWQLFGHSHNSLRDDPNILQYDVGVDAWDYCPVSYVQIKEKMKIKQWKPVDHHGSV